MEKQIKDIANVYKGQQLTKQEKEKPIDMTEIQEMTMLSFDDMISYSTVPTLSRTIVSTASIKKSSKVYINVNKKYKETNMRKGDIILPIGLKKPEPRFVNWRSGIDDEDFKNYIYSNDLIIIRILDEKQVIPEFLFHLLNTVIIRSYLRVISNKNGRHRLTCEAIEKIKVTIPDLESQRNALEELKQANTLREHVEDYFRECSTILQDM